MTRAPQLLVLLALPALAGCVPDPAPPPPPPGDLVFTEIAAEPLTGRPTWVELMNTLDEDVTLSDCLVRNISGGEFPILRELTVAPGGRLILSSGPELAGEPGVLRADAVLEGLELRHAGAEELVELVCHRTRAADVIVATTTYTWDSEGNRKGHSRQLVEDAGEEAWCEAPVRDELAYYDVLVEVDPETTERVQEFGTPGGPAVCDSLEGNAPTQAGQVLITEINVAATDGLVHEWFELWASPTNAGTMDLRGCQIVDAPHPGGEGSTRVHLVDRDLGETAIAPGERLLFAHSGGHDAATEGFLVADGTIPVDYQYGTLIFGNSDRRLLALRCPGEGSPVEIDAASYDWGRYASSYVGGTLRLSEDRLPLDRLDSTANDAPSAWCPSGADQVYAVATPEGDDDDSAPGPDPVEVTLTGTPGQPNGDCPVPLPTPGPGEVIFSEIQGDPFGGSSSEEWFEVLSLAPDDRELGGCRLVNDNLDGGSDSEYLVDPPEPLIAAPGQRLVFVRSATADFWGCQQADAVYGSVGFNNGDHESLELWCPDGFGGEWLVDRIEYDGDFLDGISRQLPLASSTAAANDLVSAWCSAPSGDPGNTFSCPNPDAPSELNEGTPGAEPNCP